MRTWLYLLLAAVLLAAVIPMTGCGEGNVIKIGALLDTSGANSPLGIPEKQTLEMMQKQINDNGGINGKQLKIIIRDTGGVESEAISLATKLIEQDNVVAIIGPTSTGESLAVIDTVNSKGVPLISLAADERITLPVGSSTWVFKTPQTTFMAVQQIYAYIHAQGFGKIAIMTDKKGFGAGGKKDLLGQALHYSLQIVSEQSFNNEDNIWDSYIADIKQSGAEAVVCWGTNPGPANFAKELKKQDIPFFGSHGIANMSFITLAGDAANGVVFPSGKLIVASQLSDSDPQKAMLLNFIADYEAKYGAGTCNTFAGHAYDALTMLKTSLGLAGIADRAKVRDELEKIHDFAGTGGIYNMSPQDHCGLSLGCMIDAKIENGHWVLLP